MYMYLYVYAVVFLTVTVKSVLEKRTVVFRLGIKKTALCYTMVSCFVFFLSDFFPTRAICAKMGLIVIYVGALSS